MKKLQRKAKQEADQKSSSDKDKDSKDDKAIKQEPASGDHSKWPACGVINKKKRWTAETERQGTGRWNKHGGT